ncbi:gamma carbonic anhydrase family protein [Streptomyces sp. NPDC050400]|uniref:gamma carbonic anhydrase family protein n=1 Tax=Streptomyces sp. NPDC050400 TaxID=3365610 RepID=UPI00378BB8C6
MGRLYSYRGASPRLAPSALLADSAELVGDVVVGEDALIAGGVRITGDSSGAVRIGARVTILENTVLRPLPDCDLVVEDDVVIGPGAVLQGCHVGSGSVVEAGALLDGRSRIGTESLVGSGACVKQRSVFPARSVIDGSPAEVMGRLRGPLRRPDWAPRSGDLAARSLPDGHGTDAGTPPGHS